MLSVYNSQLKVLCYSLSDNWSFCWITYDSYTYGMKHNLCTKRRGFKYPSHWNRRQINDTIEPTLLSTLTEFYYHGNMAQVTQVWRLTQTPPGPTAKITVDEPNTEKENVFQDTNKKMNSVEWINQKCKIYFSYVTVYL